MNKHDSLALLFIGAVLSTFYVVCGWFYNLQYMNIWWLRIILTLSGPIGFTCLGWFSNRVGGNRERNLVWAFTSLTAYLYSVFTLPPLNTLMETLPELLGIFLVFGFTLGAPIGGFSLGLYLRLVKEDV